MASNPKPLKITRAFLQVGAVVESVSKPRPGIQYTVTEVHPASLWPGRTYTTYTLDGIDGDGKPHRIDYRTMNALKTHFKPISAAPENRKDYLSGATL